MKFQRDIEYDSNGSGTVTIYSQNEEEDHDDKTTLFEKIVFFVAAGAYLGMIIYLIVK